MADTSFRAIQRFRKRLQALARQYRHLIQNPAQRRRLADELQRQEHTTQEDPHGHTHQKPRR